MKDVRILDWIATWGFSTKSILHNLLYRHLKSDFSLRKKLNDMTDLGLIEKLVYQNYTVYVLTTRGKGVLKIENGLYQYPVYSARAQRNSSTLYHDLLVQYIVSLTAKYEPNKPELYLRYSSSRNLPVTLGFFPDAYAISNSGNDILFEIEISEKSVARKLFLFNNYYNLLTKDDNYKILFIFNSDQICNRYVSLFDQPAWPVYELYKKQLRDTGETIKPTNAIRDRFVFTMLSDLPGFDPNYKYIS